MKTTLLIMAVLTGILVFSTVVCGLWMRYSGETIEDSSRVFHMAVGAATVLVGMSTIVLSVMEVYKLSN